MQRVGVAIYLVLPFLALLAGVIPVWGLGADVVSLGLFIVFFYLSGLGITVGYHRYFTHRGFTVKYRWLVYVLGMCGSMALNGRLFDWVGCHTKHHQHSDKEGDPHSPYHYGDGFWNVCRGAVYAHVGWIFESVGAEERFIKKMRSDPDLVRINNWFIPCVIVGLIAPPVIGIVIRQDVSWVFVDFVWGGLIRLFFVNHVTWCVNSVCHLWGTRPFETADESRNNLAIGLLGAGEGYHNCHHAYPRSAKHGLLPGQFDLSWVVICGLKKLGLIENVIVPSEEQLVRARMVHT